MEKSELEARLVELELRYTEQGDVVQQLNDVVWAQQQQLARLESAVGELRKHLASGSSGGEAMPHEAPPHY